MPIKQHSLSRFIAVAAFLSGTTGVLYETLYPHVLITLIGGTVYVTSATLITFLFAIGIGSVMAHRLIRWLWLTEAALGIIALCIGVVFMWDAAALLPLAAWVPQAPVARIATACLLMMPPALLAGISVPAFSIVMERSIRAGREQLSLVYALYNIGAMAAILVSEYVIIRWFGIGQALITFGLLDLVVAVIAWRAVARLEVVTDRRHIAEEKPRTQVKFWRSRIIPMVAIMGVVSGAFQMETINLANMSFGPTADVLSSVVALALAGIGIGSLIVRKVGLSLAGIALGMAFAMICPVLLWPGLLAGSLSALNTLHAFGGPGKLLFMAILLGPFFVLVGASVPAASHALSGAQQAVGNSYGKLLMVAALGNTLGIILFLALITLGVSDDVLIVGMTALMWCCAVFGKLGRRLPAQAMRKQGGHAVLVAGGVYLVLATVLQQANALPLNARIYGLRSDVPVAGVDDFQRFNSRTGIYHVNAGREFAINGYTSLYLDATNRGFHSETMMTFVSSMLSHSHQRSLVIGAASGVSARVAAEIYDQTWLLDTDPNTHAVLDYFTQANNALLNDSRIHYLMRDGMAWLANSALTFDFIQIEPTSPATQGAGKLFSAEFLRLAKARLRPGGVATAWLGAVNGRRGARVLIQTFQQVFPHVALYRFTSGYYAIMGSRDPIKLHHPNLYTQAKDSIDAMAPRDIGPYPMPGDTVAPHTGSRAGQMLAEVRSRLFRPCTQLDGPVSTLNHPTVQMLSFVGWQPPLGPTHAHAQQAIQFLEGMLCPFSTGATGKTGV